MLREIFLFEAQGVDFRGSKQTPALLMFSFCLKRGRVRRGVLSSAEMKVNSKTQTLKPPQLTRLCLGNFQNPHSATAEFGAVGFRVVEGLGSSQAQQK